MKFAKIKKRKVLETWQHKNRKTGIISLICCTLDDVYYFCISCFNKRCGLPESECDKKNCDKYIYYSSLEYGLWYNSFDKCKEAVIKWHKENKG